MTPKTINTFKSSINRENSEPVYNFTVDFADNLMKCNSYQYIRVNVISFDMINAMYNIKDQKFEFELWYSGMGSKLRHHIMDIPDGNYSVYSLKKYLEENVFNLAIDDTETLDKPLQSYFSFDYNTAQNTLTFKKKILSGDYEILHDFVFLIQCPVLGFKEAAESTFDGVSGSLYNFKD